MSMFNAFMGLPSALLGLGLLAVPPESTAPPGDDVLPPVQQDILNPVTPTAVDCNTDCTDHCSYEVCTIFGCTDVVNPACKATCEAEKVANCGIDPPIDVFFKIGFENACGHPIQIAVHVQYKDDWETHAWYHFSPFEEATLDLKLDNINVYYYAESTDGTGLLWSGEYYFDVPGRGNLGFRLWKTSSNWDTKWMQLTCSK